MQAMLLLKPMQATANANANAMQCKLQMHMQIKCNASHASQCYCCGLCNASYRLDLASNANANNGLLWLTAMLLLKPMQATCNANANAMQC
jgi:hypothetical protein